MLTRVRLSDDSAEQRNANSAQSFIHPLVQLQHHLVILISQYHTFTLKKTPRTLFVRISICTSAKRSVDLALVEPSTIAQMLKGACALKQVFR